MCELGNRLLRKSKKKERMPNVVTIEVELIDETPSSTVSILKYGAFRAFLVEDGFREVKVKHETRIPGGKHRIVARKSGGFYNRYKERYGHTFVPGFEDVPNFELILIHIGNTIEDTSGCPLINYGIQKYRVGTEWVYKGLDSANAYKEFYRLLAKDFRAGKEIFINITR